MASLKTGYSDGTGQIKETHLDSYIERGFGYLSISRDSMQHAPMVFSGTCLYRKEKPGILLRKSKPKSIYL